MTQLRISEAARLLGVSDDTVRRWVDSGRLAASSDEAGRRVVDGAALAALSGELHEPPAPGLTSAASARNRFVGIVTRVIKDTVMAQVEMQAGPFRVVSLDEPRGSRRARPRARGGRRRVGQVDRRRR